MLNVNIKYIKIVKLFVGFVIAVGLFRNVIAYTAVNDLNHEINYLYYKYKNHNGGDNASYIPALAKVDPSLFAIVIATVDGRIFMIGSADIPFAIESISKPFVYALALQDNGEKILNDQVGLNATGSQFNSIIAIEEKNKHLQNPLVNAGAIQVTSYIKGVNSDDKWQRVLNFMNSLSDSKVSLGDDYYQSESETNQHNLAISYLLVSYGLMKGSNPLDVLDRYTKACSILVSAKQLAVMGSVFANGGVSPFTHEQLVSKQNVKNVLSQLTINGMYENSGAWWTEVGVPSKSGVGGGILAIVPNKMAIVVFSPPIDPAGNSVKAQLVIKELSQRIHLHQFIS